MQKHVNDELDRQFGHLVENLRDLLYELSKYPLERPWPESLAIFAEDWIDRGLELTPRTLASIGQRITVEHGDPEDVLDADSIDATVRPTSNTTHLAGAQ